MQDFSLQEMIVTRPEQGLSGPPGLQCLCPQMCCPIAPHLPCPAATALSPGCFLEATHGLVRCCLKGTVYLETGKKCCALKCGNAAVFRNQSLCFRGVEGSTCAVSRIAKHSRAVLCELPAPAAPGTSPGCSLGPGIWVRTSDVLLLMQKPPIAGSTLSCGGSPGQSPALKLWHEAQLVALAMGSALWESSDLWGIPGQMGGSRAPCTPWTAGSAVPLGMCWGCGMASMAHLSSVCPGINLALAACCLPAEHPLWNSACAWAFFSKWKRMSGPRTFQLLNKSW